jgi:hypothetical protein
MKLQGFFAGHFPHNAGVEGSSPSLSTNRIKKLCAVFEPGIVGRLAEFLRPNSRIDFSERAEAGCRTAYVT